MVSPFSWYEGKHILITGATGYVANSILKLLNPIHCKISTFSRTSQLERWSERLEKEILGDIRDEAAWQKCLDVPVDVIFHLAAQTSVYVADKDPLLDMQVNAQAVLTMLNKCKTLGVKPFVAMASTVTISGLPSQLPVGDDYSDHPITIYDFHKQVAEGYLKYFIDLGFVQGTSLRLANVYGPGPAHSSQDRGVLNLMAKRAIAGSSLTIYGEGNYLRDYIYVDDVAAAFLFSAPNALNVSGRHFVISSGCGTVLADAIRLTAKLASNITGKTVDVVHAPPPAHLSPIESRNFVGDSSGYTKATCWTPQVSLEAGIQKTLRSVA